jgi:hypothetical protein
LNSISALNPAARDHAAQYSTLSVKLPLQSHADVIHARAWLARPGNFEHDRTDFQALPL